MTDSCSAELQCTSMGLPLEKQSVLSLALLVAML